MLLRKVRKILAYHIGVTVLAIIMTGFFAAIMIYVKPLNPIKRAFEDFSFTDIYYEISAEGAVKDTSRIITIVDLTKLTARTDIAQTLEDIESFNPVVIGVDACFDNEGEDFAGNERIISVAETYKNIVFAEKMLDWQDDETGWTTEIHSFFHEVTDITEGTVNVPRKLYDKLKRRIPLCEKYRGDIRPSFVAQVANAYAGKNITGNRTGDIDINFNPTVFRVLLPEEVKHHPELIENHIVLFGAMYEDSDTHWTPIGKIAGVELLAYGIQTVLLDNEVTYVSGIPLYVISFVIICMVQMLQSVYLKYMRASHWMFVRYVIGSSYCLNILTFLLISVFVGISFFIFRRTHVSLNLAWVTVVIAFLTSSRTLYKDICTYIEKKKDLKQHVKSIGT